MPNQTKLELLSFGDLLCTDFSPLNIAATLQTKTIDILKQEVSTEKQRIINEFKNVTCRNYEEYRLLYQYQHILENTEEAKHTELGSNKNQVTKQQQELKKTEPPDLWIYGAVVIAGGFYFCHQILA